MVAGAILPAGGAQAQCHAQQARLLGTGTVGLAIFGYSVAMSGDGNTAVVGAYGDNSNVGAACVFTRSGMTWTQQGPKLTPTGGVGTGIFGISVSLSTDGNTAAVGASGDNSNIGAAYIFTRTGTTWTQQGPKLVPTGGVGAGNFGGSISLSGDGNIAVVGADNDDSSIGAAYVFTRSGTTWTQQGPKLVPTGGVGAGRLGLGVALSSNGTTALIGSRFDDGGVGAAYVFTRSGTTWTQQAKLTPTGGTGAGIFGISVSLSSDGNTGVVGAGADNSNIGAAFVFTRSGTTWTQQGPKLVPTGGAGNGNFGGSVSLSSNGAVAAIGAPADNANTGGAYVFAGSGTTWTQQGAKLVPTGGVGAGRFGYSASLSGQGASVVIGALGDNGSVGAAYVFTVNLGTTFTLQPVNAAVFAGTTANFMVAANSNTPLTHQWRRSGVNLADGPTGTGSVISGATTPTLTITGATLADNGAAFDCIVTNACGPTRSDPAGLGVTRGCGGADFDINGVVQPADVSLFVSTWFNALINGC